MNAIIVLTLILAGTAAGPASAFENEIDPGWVPRIARACERQSTAQQQRGNLQLDLTIPEFCDCIAKRHVNYARKKAADVSEGVSHLHAILKIYTPLDDAGIEAVQTRFDADDEIDQNFAKICKSK